MPSEIRVRVVKPKDGKERAQIMIGSKAEPAARLDDFHEEIRKLLQGADPDTWIACEPCESPAPAIVKPMGTAVNPPVTHSGGGSAPQDPINPFNFVSFMSKKPGCAEDPDGAAHDRWRTERLNGRITVEFRATTPIFVPAGSSMPTSADNRRFWQCQRRPDEQPCRGLPGSSIKGVFSVVFEALTSSRLRVFDPARFEGSVRVGKGEIRAYEIAEPLIPRKSPVLEKADSAEVTLGFVVDGYGGRCFRGRLRFGTFWAQLDHVSKQPRSLRLRPLLSHRRAELYAVSAGSAPSYRGRKFYWHQRWVNEIPPQHVGTRTRLDVIVSPLPEDTRFVGRVHFENLTHAELGAVLVCLCPDLFRRSDADTVGFDPSREYGLKVGGGKPRGLGSVHPRMSDLQVRTSPSTAYESLAASVLDSRDPSEFVEAFRLTLGGATPESLSDLERVLCLPAAPMVCEYMNPRDLVVARKVKVP